MEALIVAGGRGARLAPLTSTTPKPLLPFCGEPLLAGMIRRLAAFGIERVLLVVGASTAPFERLGAVGDTVGVTVEVVDEPEPLDTAGGVMAALDRVSGPFLVCNGDILTDVDLGALAAAHRTSGARATLALTRVRDTSTYGVCVREGTRIVDFVEKPPPGTLVGQDTVNAGTYLLDPDVFDGFPPGPLSFEQDVFPTLLASGAHLEGFVWDGVWADLGTPKRFLEGHRLALTGAIRWPSLDLLTELAPSTWAGSGTHVDPEARVVPPAVLLPQVIVGPYAHIGPNTVVGTRTRVGAGARVGGSVLFDDVEIGDNARVEGLLAGYGARVGAEAHVVGDGVLGDGASLTAGSVLGDGERRPAVS